MSEFSSFSHRIAGSSGIKLLQGPMHCDCCARSLVSGLMTSGLALRLHSSRQLRLCGPIISLHTCVQMQLATCLSGNALQRQQAVDIASSKSSQHRCLVSSSGRRARGEGKVQIEVQGSASSPQVSAGQDRPAEQVSSLRPACIERTLSKLVSHLSGRESSDCTMLLMKQQAS